MRNVVAFGALGALIAACTASSLVEDSGESRSALGGVGGPGDGGGVLNPDASGGSDGVGGPMEGGVIDPGPPPLYDGLYYLHALGNRVWDFGAAPLGGPVSLATFNGSPGQVIRVTEIDLHHDVKLRVSSTSLCLGVRGGSVVVGQPLELQTCDDTSPAQRFAYDGDAILMGTQPSGDVTRELVIEPAGDVTVAGTQLVVGVRDASDAEYFRMQRVDGTTAYPHRGFVQASTEAELDSALALGWGTVIEIDPAQPLVLEGQVSKKIHAGVTLRGYRKHLSTGPEIVHPDLSADPISHVYLMFEVDETNVRITGLRVTGPTNSTDQQPDAFVGIAVDHAALDVLIDHIEAQKWPYAAIEAGDSNGEPITQDCDVAHDPPKPRATHTRILSNFIHDNAGATIGYGVVSGGGGFPLIGQNLFYSNRHSIAADGMRRTGYQATANFFLTPAPTYDGNPEPEIDKHGTIKTDQGSAMTGISDDYADVGWNTLLRTDSTWRFFERGTSCRETVVHDNVLRDDVDKIHSNTTAVKTVLATCGSALDVEDPTILLVCGNAFNVADPTLDLGVADFDGDGVDDLFVGTGVTWWFSSGGQTEWRYLNQLPEHAKDLLFGDLDLDGRADVIASHGSRLDVSWAGITSWRPLNHTGFQVSDLAIGDFDGDRRADLFLASGTEFFVSSGGTDAWVPVLADPHRRSALRFGDFTGDGKTDVFGVVGTQWKVFPGGGTAWQTLQTALRPMSDTLFVADFDGDHFADVASRDAGSWVLSPRGTGALTTLRPNDTAELTPFIGRFDGDAKGDVLAWKGSDLIIAPAGKLPTRVLPRGAMR